MKIAIHQNKKIFEHSTSWIPVYVEYCQKNNIGYEIVDMYQSNILSKLKDFDVLLYSTDNHTYTDMLFARSIALAAKEMGLKIFPDFNDCWHFDDKVAETYLLQSINASIPKSYMFYLLEDVKKWLAGYNKFPIIAKLKRGSGSYNVKMLKSSEELLRYARRMFGRGYNPAPSIFFKAKSNYHSSHGNRSVMRSKIKRIPEFLRIWKNARVFPNEKHYVYLQEFIPNDGYDMKVVVVGDKLTGVIRPIRKNDFRASGGGEVFFDKKYFTKEIIDSAFEVSDKLGCKCMGYDYVVDKSTGKGLIIEISYGFNHKALMSPNGYFDRLGVWYDEPLNAPEEIIKNILKNE